MGYAWNGACYQDTAGALAAFAKDVPSVDPWGIQNFTAAPTISTGGLITWSISNRPLNGTAATTRTGTTQLLTCTDDVGQYDLQAVVVAIALVFFFLFGFRSGFRP